MRYDGLLLVGREISMFDNLANKICSGNIFSSLRIVSDNVNGFDYIEKVKIDEIENTHLLIKFGKNDYTYAVFKNEYEEIKRSEENPVIFIPQTLYEDFEIKLKEASLNFMSIYLYKEDSTCIEKSLIDSCIYNLNCNSIESAYNLVMKLWELQCVGGGLSRDFIEKMIQCNVLIKDGKKENISNASYDLTLGDEYYYAGEIKTLDTKNPFIAIEPYDYVIASCAEKLAMPRDISGRFDVSVNLFCQGIILSNSTQVDPGFRGKLFCLLFNTSNKVVYLKRNMHYATLEFNKLIEPTTAYLGKYADEDSIVAYLPTNIMQGAINELKKEIEELKAENQKMQSIYLSVLALFLAIVSIFLVFK